MSLYIYIFYSFKIFSRNVPNIYYIYIIKNIYITIQIVYLKKRKRHQKIYVKYVECIEISDWFDFQSSREFRRRNATRLTIVKNLLGG